MQFFLPDNLVLSITSPSEGSIADWNIVLPEMLVKTGGSGKYALAFFGILYLI